MNASNMDLKLAQYLMLLVLILFKNCTCKEVEPEDTLLDIEVTTEAEHEEESIGDVDELAINTAVRDVAYYLRAYKFNEYDRRFLSTANETSKGFYRSFPEPPLKTIHWEVRTNCEEGFLKCLFYLQEKVLMANLRRADDVVTRAWDLRGKSVNTSRQLSDASAECRRLLELDLESAQPFQGPLERFQWRTSASYYMCWFTMQREPSLALFAEPCDNFAQCLPAHGDPRADDHLPYQCAAYSFCPDPCCPLKRVTNLTRCWEHEENPCLMGAPEGFQQCQLNNTINLHFNGVVLNKWNTTCSCKMAGFEWDARFGICVDVDECSLEIDTCNRTVQTCFNLPGGFFCACRWGYILDPHLKECVYFKELFSGPDKTENATEKPMSASIFKNILKKISPAKGSSTMNTPLNIFFVFSSIFFNIKTSVLP